MSQVPAVVLLLFSSASAEKKNRTTEEKENWQPVHSQHADFIRGVCSVFFRVLKIGHHNESKLGNMVNKRFKGYHTKTKRTM